MDAELIEFEVARTKEDYFWGILHNSLRAPRVLLILAMFGIMGGALTSGYFVDGGMTERLVFVVGGTVFLFALYALSLVVVVVVSTLMSWRLPGAFSPVRFEFSPGGMKVSHETGKGETSWAVWRSFFETRSVFVLRHVSNAAQIIPKRSMAAGTVDALRGLLQRQLRKNRKVTP